MSDIPYKYLQDENGDTFYPMTGNSSFINPVPVNKGGTGGATVASALANLGLTNPLVWIGDNPSGYNIDTYTNPSGFGWMNDNQVSGTFPSGVGYGMLVHFYMPSAECAMQLYISENSAHSRMYATGSWRSWRSL